MLVLPGLVQFFLFFSSVFVAESHKTLQAIICDILFLCADYAISEGQEKPRTDLLCQKNKQKKTMGARREQERDKDRGNVTIMFRKTI